METIIFIVIVCVLVCIWSGISDSIEKSEYRRERKEEYDRAATEARKQYPKIENWSAHPLFALASAFLVDKIDNYIEIAKRTPAGATGGLTLEVRVKTLGIYVGGRYLGDNYFYYSDQGYDQIKVGYTFEETSDACKEFAEAMSKFLSNYYLSRENINVGNNIYSFFTFPDSNYDNIDWCFSIELRDIQPKLKQV